MHEGFDTIPTLPYKALPRTIVKLPVISLNSEQDSVICAHGIINCLFHSIFSYSVDTEARMMTSTLQSLGTRMIKNKQTFVKI